MNYEQEYKNAFEAAKGLHDAGNALTKKQMEIVSPQLAESEDERIRKFLIDYFTSYKIGNVATKLNGYRIDDILAYLEKQKEPKPVVTHGETYRVDTLGTQQVIAGKMPQKPAEWSEEDEKHKEWILECLADGKRKVPEYADQYQSAFDWLKSLRPVSKEFLQPHWKPSEEQMKAFKGYIQDFQERAEAAVGGWNNFDVMIRLYEQLKKLM